LFSVAAVPVIVAHQRVVTCDAKVVQPPAALPLTIPQKKTEQKTLIKSAIDRAEKVVYYVRRFVRHLKRLLMYALLGTPVVAIASTAYAFGGVAPAVEEYVWDFCLWAVQALGPTFIKLAQWASTRPDLYPPGLVARLELLQDQVKVHYSFKTVERTLLEAFGPDWREKLEIDHNPIGAGCVAQVFKGHLKDKERTPVAIKLIHPHVEKMIKSDMELLTILTRWMDKFPNLEVLSLGETCRQWCENMNKQLDLRVEASNLIKFAKKFKEDHWAVFPKPIDGMVTKNVLVETLVPGTPIVNYMKLGDDDPEERRLKLQLSDLGSRAVVKMVFFDNLIHGDMHPGKFTSHNHNDR
jgi:aarF domain-containing kinase